MAGLIIILVLAIVFACLMGVGIGKNSTLNWVRKNTNCDNEAKSTLKKHESDVFGLWIYLTVICSALLWPAISSLREYYLDRWREGKIVEHTRCTYDDNGVKIDSTTFYVRVK